MNLKEQVLKNVELSKKKEEFQKYIKFEDDVEQNKDIINFIELQILENSLKKIDAGIIDVSKFDVIFKEPRDYKIVKECKGNILIIYVYFYNQDILIYMDNQFEMPPDYIRCTDFDYHTYKILSITYKLKK
jgi:hypothetical protein